MVEKSIFEQANQEVFELFGDYLEGGSERPFLVLSSRMLEESAREAIGKSLMALGYEGGCCTYATLAETIDKEALFILVEGLDPIYAIVTDESALIRLAEAYRTDYKPDAPIRLFGRTGIAFRNLEESIESPEGKRLTWELMKRFS